MYRKLKPLPPSQCCPILSPPPRPHLILQLQQCYLACMGANVITLCTLRLHSETTWATYLFTLFFMPYLDHIVLSLVILQLLVIVFKKNMGSIYQIKSHILHFLIIGLEFRNKTRPMQKTPKVPQVTAVKKVTVMFQIYRTCYYNTWIYTE